MARSITFVVLMLAIASSTSFIVQTLLKTSSHTPSYMRSSSLSSLSLRPSSLRMTTADMGHTRDRSLSITSSKPVNDVISSRRLRAPVGSVKTIMSMADFHAELDSAAADGAIVIVKYFAGFCKACKRIEESYENLANEMEGSNLRFMEVKFEDNKELCRVNGIKSLPHVQVFADKKPWTDMSLTPSKFENFVAYLSEHMGKTSTFTPKTPSPAIA